MLIGEVKLQSWGNYRTMRKDGFYIIDYELIPAC
uniref:Uncharacterized protein n=1 Tax=Anguilla anguilla TaxID=7936 RepID=A0A0E9PKE8_ANGAN